MSDRKGFWPAPPDWSQARIATPGVTVAASHGDRAVTLLGGPRAAIEALAAPHLGEGTLLWIAPDRALLVSAPGAGLGDGWHPSGVAQSDLTDAHVRFDIRGTGAADLLRQGSMALALTLTPTGAALAFAGVTLLYEPLADGARLHVDLPSATHVWNWLLAATQEKDHR